MPSSHLITITRVNTVSHGEKRISVRTNSRLIHGSGHSPDGGVLPAIQLSSTFEQPTDGTFGEFVYQRGGNPTRNAAERLLASVEGASHAALTSTGMAATSSVFSLLVPGDKVLLSRSIYGGTYRYVTHYFPRQGIDFEFVDDFNAIEAENIDDAVKLIFIETPANPTLEVIDISRLAQAAHARSVLLAVDNTFMTPLLQRPLEQGADVVVYSATKYLGGHGDLLAGLVVTNNAELYDDVTFYRKTFGPALSPFDSFSLLRGVKTLDVRLKRQQETAARVIDHLSGRSEIVALNYPGSRSPAQAAIHARQANGIGAVISFQLDPSLDRRAFLDALGFIGYAVSLGGVESLICAPATMTHEPFSAADRAAAAIPDDLLRLAVGIEDADDILDLLDAGLAASRQA